MSIDDISNSDLSTLIDEWIKNERNRKILKDRLINGLCYEPLAEKYELSVRQVKNIVYRSEIEILKRVGAKRLRD